MDDIRDPFELEASVVILGVVFGVGLLWAIVRILARLLHQYDALSLIL